MPSCQLERAQKGDSRQKSAPEPGTQCPPIAPACQWLTTTAGRIALDGHSWMTAVHWAADPKTKRYLPTRTHGPRAMNATTIVIAQECANLLECRPGIAYLARKARCSERTVEYHLDMLREAGLLAYASKGTRTSGGPNQASVYERVIPTAFDEALGIRTTQRNDTAPAYSRVPVGIAETGRKLIGKLAKKASRKVRRRRPRTPVMGRNRCTPMQGGTSAPSSTGTSTSPSETRLASGSSTHPTQKKTNRGPQKLNKIGRRYQLARELITNVPWLERASVPRISWIARHCADDGWTWREVQAAAEEHSPIDPMDSRRPSGLLAYRLKGVHQLYAKPAAREQMVLAWHESTAQEHFRHSGYGKVTEHAAPDTVEISDAQAAFGASMRTGSTTRPASTRDDGDEGLIPVGDLDLHALSAHEIGIHQAWAAADPTYVRSLLNEMGDTATRQLLTNRLVNQALAALRITTTPTLANAF
ncbi:transcriptional regulator [Streptomyces sp. NPDC048445]|uniref:transcriptional regulator n=1 Tax=Streptomyces sp. NPDC048445 TaxID=3365553 RepID=UPI003718952C